MRVVGSIATAVLVVFYPIAIWVGLTHLSARTLGLWMLLLLVPLALLRFRRAARDDLKAALRVPLAILAVVSLSIITNDGRFVLAMPVLISLVLFVTFASSLFEEHTIIERFARMQEARMAGGAEVQLTSAQIAHCRQVTWVWCGFFIFNGAIAALLALTAPLSWWAAYTSGISYALMGLLFIAEYVVRQYRFRRYGTGLHDRLLSRILPPRGPDR